LVLSFLILSASEVLQKDFPLAHQWGNLIEILSEVIGNPLINLLESIRGHWQFSEKYLFQGVEDYRAPFENSPEGIGKFQNDKYFSEGCQYALIAC
jgi:hypothetical protein